MKKQTDKCCKKIGIGIIGAGRRGIRCLGSRIAEQTQQTGFSITAVCDRNPARMQEAAQILEKKFAEHGTETTITCYPDYQSLIDDPAVELIMITTPSYAHRDPVIAALRSGKKVYLDKPIAQNMDDSIAIMKEEQRTGNRLIMGFTRRYENPWRKAFALLQEGIIGDLCMVQIRAVIPYDVYAHTWHRRREWSGSPLNDKSSHHFDVFNWFAGSRAERISAFGGQRVYTPEDDAPAFCAVCSRECPYRVDASPLSEMGMQDVLRSEGDSWECETEEMYRADNCVYRPGSDLEDHATIHIAYENGITASLFWCIFGPRSEDQETLELVGTKGRIILTRHTAELDIVTDYGKRHEVIDCKDDEFPTSHFGADLKLIRDMRAFFDGTEPAVSAKDGFESTRMVMAALQSIDAGGELVRMQDFPGGGLTI
ncbi:MAG: Gfo/Idh/MocA family oxidoreductase [Kiritimatiellales bacterium]